MAEKFLYVGAWLGQENRIMSLTLNRKRGWSAHDSTGADYTEADFPDGLCVADEPYPPGNRRERRPWPGSPTPTED